MSAKKHTCEKRIFPRDSWSSSGHLCGRTATLEHEKRWYCKTHHPPTVTVKQETRYRAYSDALDRRDAIEQQMRDDHARMEALEQGGWPALSAIINRSPDEWTIRASIDQWMKERTAPK